MMDKQTVIAALQRLPENAALDDITEEFLRILVAIKRGRTEAATAPRAMNPADAQLLTYDEAAARLGLKRQYISRRVSRGELVATDLGHHTKRISELDLLKYIERKRAVEKTRRRLIG